MLISLDAPAAPDDTPVLFRAGFRPFFLAAGIEAVLMVPAWLVIWLGGHDLALSYPPVLWHAHEMLFGFAMAAVAGFLLTAAPNWTGAPPVRGRALMALAGLWLAGRVAFDLGGALPPIIAAVPAILFPPVLAFFLARPLLAAGKPRNLIFLPILGALTVAEALVLAEMLGWGSWGRNGLLLGIFILLLMIAIIGGRIIPGFTANGLRQRGIVVTPKSIPILEKAAIGALALTGVAWTVRPDSAVAGALALLAAILNAARLAGWHGGRTLGVPLLWVLHLGFAWLPLGLVLLGLSCFSADIPPQAALHGLTVGCIAMMVLGVMSRAALGHSGRPLAPTRPTIAAYVLIALAGIVRTFGALAAPETTLPLSGLLWSAGFALYVLAYAPICLAPRTDGQPG
ncbi:NnrS family protein [Telmatospirillum siberiense]|uniref:NnrS family protein n=1 Tax=Telmatospirillum siberiense TaxID=382514 RepID=A0A2N3PWS0_9PROT|nr:NnrS family protein [Telmatospirillum siberiense]PKU24862.1 NnrS family protein [Telmatospirillum siberiense]